MIGQNGEPLRSYKFRTMVPNADALKAGLLDRNEMKGPVFKMLSIKPGMTCLWQVSGRNAVNDFDDWVRMDIEYIENWSFWLDLKILFRTAWVVVAGTGK